MKTTIRCAALLLTGIAGASGATDSDVVRAYIDAYNAHDIEAMLVYASDDIRWMTVDGESSTTETTGKDELASTLSSYFESLPSARSEIRAIYSVAGNLAVVEETFWERDGIARSQCVLATYEVTNGLILNIWYHNGQPCGDAIDLPDGEGRQILSSYCIICHKLEEATKFKGYYGEDEWRDVVLTMISYGAPLPDHQVAVVVQYLTKYFGPQSD